MSTTALQNQIAAKFITRAKKSIAMTTALFCLLIFACCLFAPENAFAQEAATTNDATQKTGAVAHSELEGTTTYYYSIDDAISAAKGQKIIYLDCDWNLTSALVIPQDTSINIDMNCHKISNNGTSEVIHMEKYSQLYLSAESSTTFTYKGYTSTYKSITDPDKDLQDITIECGGLVTGGKFTDNFTLSSQAGGIYMETGSGLFLSNVAVAGNYVNTMKYNSNAGGIFANESCHIGLYSGASIEHNKGVAGGIYAGDRNIEITLDNSSIRQNYAFENGGGIYSDGDGTHIDLTKNATIEGNASILDGGGVYFNDTNFNLESSDSTGVIKDNVAGSPENGWGGGGVYVDSKPTGDDNKGSIANLTFTGNTCGDHGAAICLSQNNTVVSGCTITDNKAQQNGGGIAVESGYCTIKDCVVRDNTCNLANKNYEGGGIYVGLWCDVNLSGVMIVKDNTRSEGGSKDDVFLGDDDGDEYNAYIRGGVSKGSSVGVRTGTQGDLRIGKNINNESKDSFFIDLDGYYVSYGTDEGGDMWQRHKTLEFKLSINGSEVGKYQYDASVTASGVPSDTSKHFWYWDAQETTGLYPISDYLTDNNKYDESLTFAMPQNDANLAAVYADTITKVGLFVQTPVVGSSLPQTATLWRMDAGVGGIGEISVPLSWYEVNENGKEVAVTGAAQAGKTYFARVNAEQVPAAGLFFSSDITGKDITIYTKDDTKQGVSATSAAVDASTGTCSITTQNFALPGGLNPDPIPSPNPDNPTKGDVNNTEKIVSLTQTDTNAAQGKQNTALASTGDASVTYGITAALVALASAATCVACALRAKRNH